MFTCVEICAGAGGQALGLALAGFVHVALIEYEQDYCNILKQNRPEWPVICKDVQQFDGRPYRGVDLLAGGVPCPPFSKAGKQLGENDERDLFPEAIRLIGEIQPRAVMLENVRGFLDSTFDDYRNNILGSIEALGYTVHIKLLNSSDYGVPQLRPRVVIIGIREDISTTFQFPEEHPELTSTVGNVLYDLMAADNWKHAKSWAKKANQIAPTIVGGSKKHGGPDLGPTRAKKAWAELGVDGHGIANAPPNKEFEGMPKLTSRMIARIQGFPDQWTFGRKKTIACRMIGNAFPPPVAYAVGNEIRRCFEMVNKKAIIAEARKQFHAALLDNNILSINNAGVPTNADKDNKASVAIASSIANKLMAETNERRAGQTSGAAFEEVTTQFVKNTFPKFQHLRPGKWTVLKLGNRSKIKASAFAQYEHLAYLDELTKANKKLSAMIGNDYMVSPDIVVYRELYTDEELNSGICIVDKENSKMADLRESSGGKPILHASVSAKWTIRSDRAQNSRTEALNLIRNRKGSLPHIVVVTGEPLPSRLSSIALGTGDIDCVYHFALYELIEAVDNYGREDVRDTLKTLIDGKRLKDISDLPLDLSV